MQLSAKMKTTQLSATAFPENHAIITRALRLQSDYGSHAGVNKIELEVAYASCTHASVANSEGWVLMDTKKT